MKAWKKIMAGTLVGAMSAGMLAAAPANADVAISGNKAITGMTANKETYVSYDYIKDKKDTPTVNAKAKWDVYTGTTAADLSSLKTTKKQYVTVDDGSKKTTYIFAENKDKYSAKCDGKKITFKKGKDEIAEADLYKDNKALFEYRTEAGSWGPYIPTGSGNDVFSLAPFEQQGATLYFRTKAVEPSNGNAAQKITDAFAVDGIDSKQDGYSNKYEFWNVAANGLAGKEFKVKIPKKSNGPSISVDYNKNIIKEVKNGQMKTAVDSAVDNIATATFEPAKAYTIDSSKKGVFEAKTVKDGKPDSKISIYKWDAVATPDVKVGATSTFGPSSTLTPELAVSAFDPSSKTKSFTLKNSSDTKTYLVYVGDTAPKVGDKAVATIKPGKEVKIVETKAASGAKLWIGCAGDKKSDTLASLIVQSGIVYYPTPSPTAAGN